MSDSPSLARAKNVALRYLAARARSEAQVRDRLRRAELGLEADAAVAWLVGLGYLDDVAYARSRAIALGAGSRASSSAAASPRTPWRGRSGFETTRLRERAPGVILPAPCAAQPSPPPSSSPSPRARSTSR